MNKYKGLFIRPDTMDKDIIREQSSYSKLTLDNQYVLDLGGNIGAFADFAFNNGAERVVSVEPDPDNFGILRKNRKSKFHTILEAAAVSSVVDEDYVKLYKNFGINKGSHSLYVKRGRNSIGVKTLQVKDLYELYKPSCLKIDIEGGEYIVLKDEIISTVKHLAVEFHLNKVEWRHMFFPNLLHDIRIQGFSFVKEPVNTGKNWHTLGIFERK